MKKKLAVLLVSTAMVLSLVACGSSAETATVDDTVTEEVAEDTTEEAVEEEVVEEDAEAVEEDAEATDELTADDLAAYYTETYMGLTEAEEAVVFMISEDGSEGIICFAAEDGQCASFVGAVTDNGDGTMTIDDETSQTSLTFGVALNEDETVSLDMGDLGTATVALCDPVEAADTLLTIDANFVSVN